MVASDSSYDSVAQMAAAMPFKETKGEMVSPFERIISPTVNEGSISTEDSDAGERPTPPPVLRRARRPCLPARPVVESALPIAVA